MARHNREGEGTDQRGFNYTINYPPDWLRHVKVGRALPSGRQSTMILFRNPVRHRMRSPGDRIRTRIQCPDQGVDLEVVLHDPHGRTHRAQVSCWVPNPDGPGEEEVVFTLEDGLPPAP